MSFPKTSLITIFLAVAACGSEVDDALEVQPDMSSDMESLCNQESCDDAQTVIVTLHYEGLNQPLTVLEVTVGEPYGVLPDPSRSGYAFAGWWTERLGKGQRILSTDVVSANNNHELYANWRPGKTMVTTGHDHTCVLKTDGNVWCSGNNDEGQYGDGTLNNSATPVQVIGPDKFIQISASDKYTCGIKTDDTVACWGRNLAASHGLDYGERWNEPIHVRGLTEVSNVTTGPRHVCATRFDRTVWCWGLDDGRLGGEERYSAGLRLPGQVPELADVVDVRAGDNHTCALHRNSTLSCWGANDSGQLGRQTGLYGSSPILVPQIADVVDFSLGEDVSCAVKTDGTVWCWGNVESPLIDQSAPAPIAGISDAKKVRVDGQNACILREDRTLWCWGSNVHEPWKVYGADIYLPSPIDGFDDVIEFDLEARHMCAMDLERSVWCRGYNDRGQLGIQDPKPPHFPGLVHDLPAAHTTSFVLGQTCAVTNDAELWCWGGKDLDEHPDAYKPERKAGFSNILQVESSANHACFLNSSGNVWCWGRNSDGQLGNGTFVDSNEPVRVAGLNRIVEISVAGYYSCALREDGTVWCWGKNDSRQLGDASTISRSTAGQVRLGLPDVRSISTSGKTACAVTRDELLWCWGDGELAPYQVIGPTGVSQIELGFVHACLRNKDGEVICWGSNENGELGNGSDDFWEWSNLVSLEDVRSFTTGGRSSCAVKTDDSVWCWGPNGGSSGDGSLQKELRPRQVHAPDRVRTVNVFETHACVRTWSDSTWCWGSHQFGQIGRTALVRTPKVTLF